MHRDAGRIFCDLLAAVLWKPKDSSSGPGELGELRQISAFNGVVNSLYHLAWAKPYIRSGGMRAIYSGGFSLETSAYSGMDVSRFKV